MPVVDFFIADPGYRNWGCQSWRAKTLLLIFIIDFIKIDRFYCAESSTTRYASPFAYAICMQAKFLQCEATRTVESSITEVATNNYSMNFNYLATRGGTGPRFPPWIRYWTSLHHFDFVRNLFHLHFYYNLTKICSD